MYYPYLRGKQFELLALREFSKKYKDSKSICPIIEPVKLQLNGLRMAIDVMTQSGLRFALVLNPGEGDFKRNKVNFLKELPQLGETLERWIPAYIYRNNTDEILDAVSSANQEEVMVVFPTKISWNNEDVVRLLSDERVGFIVGDFAAGKIKKLTPQGKNLIKLDDAFNEKARNTDYAQEPDEFFTEMFLDYADEGFAGFSDYTTLPSSYKESGMLPFAVAIHLTYRNEGQEVNIHHFVSDTNDDRSNIQGKFAEANNKLCEFFKDHPHTSAVEAFYNYREEGRYPGLGVLKKLSIKNHLELMNRILD